MRAPWPAAMSSGEGLGAVDAEICCCDGGGGGGMCVTRVMTEKQLETLRQQIAIYAAICNKLVEMHRAFVAQQDSQLAAGMRLAGGLYCDPLTSAAGGGGGIVQKMATRQRWTPTPMQLQLLESMFEQGTGTPSKQKIKEITSRLSHHGHISETNVYNWFQNRRARTKRKQSSSTVSPPPPPPPTTTASTCGSESDGESPPMEKGNNKANDGGHAFYYESPMLNHRRQSHHADDFGSFRAVDEYGRL